MMMSIRRATIVNTRLRLGSRNAENDGDFDGMVDQVMPIAMQAESSLTITSSLSEPLARYPLDHLGDLPLR